MEDSAKVDVTENDLLTFSPQNIDDDTGLIIYPDTKVEPEAYAHIANKIAQAGYEVMIAPMPSNFAIFNSDAADEVISKFAGHSLCGVMATKYASENTTLKGLILYTSYPQDDSLKDSNIEVTSILESLDGVANLNKVVGAKYLLPSSKIIELYLIYIFC